MSAVLGLLIGTVEGKTLPNDEFSGKLGDEFGRFGKVVGSVDGSR